MNISDETLMAYADGELDATARGQVELAMQADPGVAARVRQHIALRQAVLRSFAHGQEGAPRQTESSSARARTARPKVVQLDSVRAVRRQPAAAHAATVPPRPWSWAEWGMLGASLLLGIIVGILGVNSFQSETQFAMVNGNGTLRAHSKLDAALSTHLASAPAPRGALRIGISFVGRDGQYCRSFELGAAAGLACRAGSGWNLPVLVEGQGDGSYRQAGSAMPPAVQAAIDARAVGPALDARAEQAAAARGWSR